MCIFIITRQICKQLFFKHLYIVYIYIYIFLQYVLNPTFTKQQIKILDTESKLSRAYDGATYLPGIVGLNNIKANDYCNVILHVSCSTLTVWQTFKILTDKFGKTHLQFL